MRRHLCRRLNLKLYRELYAKLFAAPYRELFAKLFRSLFRRFFVSLFAAMFGSMSAWLQASSRLALYRQMLLPRQSLGRGVGGRIVVRNRRTTSYG